MVLQVVESRSAIDAAGSTANVALTSSREDIPIQSAQKAINEYAGAIGRVFDDAALLLSRALTASYVAVIHLQKDPERLADFLGAKGPGPTSVNPSKPIVRRLWKGTPTRDSIHRYASCIALAQREKIDACDFSEWLANFPGGIKAAAAKWSRTQKLPDSQVAADKEKISRRDALLSKYTPIALPPEVGCRRAGVYLAAMRVYANGDTELVKVLDELPTTKVDSIIIGAIK
jgi:hypothetical protein